MPLFCRAGPSALEENSGWRCFWASCAFHRQWKRYPETVKATTGKMGDLVSKIYGIMLVPLASFSLTAKLTQRS